MSQRDHREATLHGFNLFGYASSKRNELIPVSEYASGFPEASRDRLHEPAHAHLPKNAHPESQQHYDRNRLDDGLPGMHIMDPYNTILQYANTFEQMPIQEAGKIGSMVYAKQLPLGVDLPNGPRVAETNMFWEDPGLATGNLAGKSLPQVNGVARGAVSEPEMTMFQWGSPFEIGWGWFVVAALAGGAYFYYRKEYPKAAPKTPITHPVAVNPVMM
jgi:hypothetical protein